MTVKTSWWAKTNFFWLFNYELKIGADLSAYAFRSMGVINSISMCSVCVGPLCMCFNVAI